MTFRDAQAAFADAIKSGRLSADPKSPVYAGRYMYMGTRTDGPAPVDTFKHVATRRYLAATTPGERTMLDAIFAAHDNA